jgi:hypothetical protein
VLHYSRKHNDDVAFDGGYVLSVSGAQIFLVLQAKQSVLLASVYGGQLEILKELELPQSENADLMSDPIVFEASRNRGSATFYQILPPTSGASQTNSPLKQLKIRIPKTK